MTLRGADRPLRATGRLHERPTLDVVVIIFACLVAAVIGAGVAGVVLLEAQNTATNTDEIVAIVDTHISTILGALLGLVAGQAVGRRDTPDYR